MKPVSGLQTTEAYCAPPDGFQTAQVVSAKGVPLDSMDPVTENQHVSNAQRGTRVWIKQNLRAYRVQRGNSTTSPMELITRLEIARCVEWESIKTKQGKPNAKAVDRTSLMVLITARTVVRITTRWTTVKIVQLVHTQMEALQDSVLRARLVGTLRVKPWTITTAENARQVGISKIRER
jgi:hypothetical protein